MVIYESIQQQPNTEHEATTEVRSPQPGVAQIVLGGQHDLSTAVQLEETFDQALASCSHLIVDASSVEFIDASTITALLNAQKAATDRDCRFNLVLSTTPLVERVLEITGVLETLNRVRSLEEALQVSWEGGGDAFARPGAHMFADPELRAAG